MDARVLVLTTLVTLFLPLSFSHSAQPPDYKLEKVVEISRHGVRPPTAGDRKLMEAGSQRAWPRWLTEDGHLTGHGYTAAWLKARYESQRYRQLGLLPAGCPGPQDVYLRASTLQRTQATAEAWSAAAFPGCGVPVHALSHEDPLFSYPSGKATAAEKARSRQEALAALGGDLQQAEKRLQPQIAALKKAVCRENQPCPVFEQPWALKVWSNGGVAIEGLDTLAAMAETLRLAWSENQPAPLVAFGHAHSSAELSQLLPLLTAKYDYTNDLPSAALRGGSLLLNQIVQALKLDRQPTLASDKGQDQADLPPDVRWLLYVASDINIAYLRTLIDFSWQQGEYPRGNIPPAASLVFERWQSSHGERFLRIYFQSQSLDQIRQLTPPGPQAPLLVTEWQGKGCRVTSVGTLCPFDTALQQIEKNIDPPDVSVSYPQNASQRHY
ncbi:histidine-type phosphatase [Erwinia pyri]|uniref:Histidine-type phosphatase n=1 Tax=Erwinia pyri TaxID=3062598 RepID=A0AA50DHH9_9GAMM|nr:histidine-type phosphatase [Erwinia sp. DE2]WLS78042.1 histidine-type phosphatase [Erwinia sp. DE2]